MIFLLLLIVKSSHLDSEVHMIDMTYLRLSSERSHSDLSISARFGLISFKMSEKMMNEDIGCFPYHWSQQGSSYAIV